MLFLVRSGVEIRFLPRSFLINQLKQALVFTTSVAYSILCTGTTHCDYD